MGLDMYAYVVPKEAAVDPVNVNKELFKSIDQFWYWRKHHDLHGWMEQLYRKKGGKKEFNCQYVELTIDDLDQLERDVTNYQLPSTTGFFFGNNPPCQESVDDDLAFIAAAREVLLTTDSRVYYSSWW